MNTTGINANVSITYIHQLIITIILGTTAILGTIINIFIVILTLSNKRFRNVSSNIFLLMHTQADAFICFIAAPIMAYNLNRNIEKGVCKLHISLTTSCSFLTLYGLAALSADRYLAIAKPFFYKAKVTKKFVVITIIFFYVFSMLSAAPLIIVENAVRYGSTSFHCAPNMVSIGKWYSIYLLTLRYAVPISVIVVCNFIVFKIARRQYAKVHIKLKERKEISQLKAEECINAEIINEDGLIIANSNNAVNSQVLSNEQSLACSTARQTYQMNIDVHASNSEKVNNCESTHKKCEIFAYKNCIDMKCKKESNSVSKFKEGSTTNILSNTTSKKSSISLFDMKQTAKDNNDKLVDSKGKYNNILKNNIQIAVSTFLLIIVLALSFLPFIVTIIIKKIDRSIIYPVVSAYTPTGHIIISAINPVVVLLSRRELRKMIRSILNRRAFLR